MFIGHRDQFVVKTSFSMLHTTLKYRPFVFIFDLYTSLFWVCSLSKLLFRLILQIKATARLGLCFILLHDLVEEANITPFTPLMQTRRYDVTLENRILMF